MGARRCRFTVAAIVVAAMAGVSGAGGATGLTSTQTAKIGCGGDPDSQVVSWSITNSSASPYEARVVWSGTETITLDTGTLGAHGTLSGALVIVAAPHPVVRFQKSDDNWATSEEVDLSPTPPAFCGYQFATSDGAVLTFRIDSGLSTETQPLQLNQPVAGIVSTRDRRGYWLVARDGGVFAFGNAAFFGSTGAMRLNRPVTGMAATPDGHGYLLVAADGGVFAFGRARYLGSASLGPAVSVVGIATTPQGNGYWLVTSEGVVLAFGDASPHGDLRGISLRAPVTGIAATPDGGGYWVVAADGGVFAFGDAHFAGSAGALALGGPVVGVLATPGGGGYWLAGSDGGVFGYGDAPYAGSAGRFPPGRLAPVVGMVVAR